MKKSYKSLSYVILLLFIFILLPELSHAQPDPDCPPDYVCPIDSGLVPLIAVGVGYGIKKIWYHKKTKSIS